jgi:hypothetical protein
VPKSLSPLSSADADLLLETGVRVRS